MMNMKISIWSVLNRISVAMIRLCFQEWCKEILNWIIWCLGSSAKIRLTSKIKIRFGRKKLTPKIWVEWVKIIIIDSAKFHNNSNSSNKNNDNNRRMWG